LSKKDLFVLNENGQYVCSICGATFDFGEETLLEQHLKAHRRESAKPWRQMTKEEKLQALVDADERMKRNRELAEKATVKTLSQIVQETDKVLKAYVKELDCAIKFKKMTVEQFLSLPEDPKEATYYMVYYQLHNADETVTKEQVWGLSFDVADCILTAMSEATHFLNLPSLNELQEVTQDKR